MQKIKHKSNKKTKNRKSSDKILKDFIKLEIYSVIIYLIIFILSSLFSVISDLSAEKSYIVSVSSFTISSFITGFISGLKFRKNGLLYGIGVAAPINIVLLILSLIMNKFQMDINIFISAVLLIVASAIGGILSVNTKLKK